MIILYHDNNRVSRIVGAIDPFLLKFRKGNIAAALFQLAKEFPDKKIVWCSEEFAHCLNIEIIELLCHHQKMMLSYSVQPTIFLQKHIGYIEQSPFIKVNSQVQYPTWLMSANVGMIHASVLAVFLGQIKPDKDFEYFLNSIAKLALPKGLFCYSEPRLLMQTETNSSNKQPNTFTLFRFVRQHFKKRWLLLLFVNGIIFEKRFPLFPFLYAFFYKSRRKLKIDFDAIPVQSTIGGSKELTIDVIIPTIGRKKYLYDVLKDLAKQTLLPINVIIVEQNPDLNSVSNLDYLTTENWPFAIKHTFTHQAGACNARNLALNQVESEWVFLADDDIRLKKSFFEFSLRNAEIFGVSVFTTSCLQKNEKQEYITIHQSRIFGSGNSFVKKAALQKASFDTALEFGYGEDTDFGFQLRNQGYDIIFFPNLKITHLKAPIGGFRTLVVKDWDTDKIQPKPSPTVMLCHKKHDTREQVLGYKIILFLKFYKYQKIIDPVRYSINFQKRWRRSLFWANQLSQKR